MTDVTPPPAIPAVPAAPLPASAIEIEAYKSMATLFNSEETSFWMRNNILVVVQGGLIAATASIVGNADKALGATASPRVALLWFVALCVLAAVGLMTAVAWAFMVGRSERIADVVLEALKQLEGELADRGVLANRRFHGFNVFSTELRRTSGPGVRRLNRIRLSRVWATLGGALAAVWLMLLLGFGVALASGVTADPHNTTAPTPAPAPLAPEVLAALQAAAQAATAAASAAQVAAAQASGAQAAAEAAVRAAARPAALAAPATAPRARSKATPPRRP